MILKYRVSVVSPEHSFSTYIFGRFLYMWNDALCYSAIQCFYKPIVLLH